MLPIHFPKSLTIVLAILFFFNAPAYAVNVGETVVAKEYNDILRMWIDRRLGILINTDRTLVIAADTGLGRANAFFPYSNSLRKELESSVLKAIEWSRIAKKNKVDVRKQIGCFEKTGEFSKRCFWNEHVPSEEYNYLSFEFASLKKGKETNLIVTITGGYNEFKKATLYLELPEMKQLLRNVQGIDKALEEAYAMKKNRIFSTEEPSPQI